MCSEVREQVAESEPCSNQTILPGELEYFISKYNFFHKLQVTPQPECTNGSSYKRYHHQCCAEGTQLFDVLLTLPTDFGTVCLFMQEFCCYTPRLLCLHIPTSASDSSCQHFPFWVVSWVYLYINYNNLSCFLLTSFLCSQERNEILRKQTGNNESNCLE